MSHKLGDAAIQARLDDAAANDYDGLKLCRLWGIQYQGACAFMLHFCPDEYHRAMKLRVEREKGAVIRKCEYVNQRLFDLQVLTKEQWCEKWDIPLWEYASYLKKYERQCHERLATPERLERWMKKYWKSLGE